jgi:transposase
MERIFEYRLRPNRAQETALFKLLAASHRLYNDALAELSVRTHICRSCGFVADRDVNAAINILQARTGPSRSVL